jgi:hypothetical protein
MKRGSGLRMTSPRIHRGHQAAVFSSYPRDLHGPRHAFLGLGGDEPMITKHAFISSQIETIIQLNFYIVE